MQAVAYREEILRGVRLAAVAFAALLLSVAGYRVLVPAAEAPAAPPPPAQPPPPPEPVQIAAPREAATPVVPPPPPVRRPKRVPAPRTATPPAGIAPPETARAIPPLADIGTEPAASESAPKEAAAEETAQPPVIVKPPEPQPSRGIRLVRALGRALHLRGRREPGADALR